MKKKPAIGILGGVGCGKSTVADCFARLGCAVIDADGLAHEVLRDREVAGAVIERFGLNVLGAGGAVDRAALGRRVFGCPEDLAFLNGVIHPRVLARCEALMEHYQGDSGVAAIVLDMPLLVEVGWEKRCDFLVFVDCEEAKRAERVAKNGKIDVNELKKREKCQISLDKKKQIAHYSVHNNSDISDVAEQIAQLFSSITKGK